MALDIDNPETYPDDLETLEKIANGEYFPEEETPVEDEPAKEEETPKPKPSEPEPADTGEDPEPEGVSTKDGKHVIPFSVLEQARIKNRELEAELKALREQTKEAPKPADPAPAEAGKDEVPTHVLEKAEALRKDWGDHFAEQFVENYKLSQQVAAQNKVLEELRTSRANEIAQRQQTEETEIADAVANSPTLVLWESQPDSGWFGKSVELHTTLMKIDPGYAAASWADRMQVLPGKMKALYPDAPTVEPAPDSKKIVADKVTEATAKAKEKSVPTSISDIRGGEGEANEQPAKKLDLMSGDELQAFMNNMAPADLEKFLSTL